MQLTREQEQALKILKARILANERVSVFEGYAGCGKTVTLSFLLEALNYNEETVHFCAYTGTAAKLLMDSGLSASTIHALIYEPIIVRGECVGFVKKDPDKLSHLRLIVIDEYSMLPQDILIDLLSYNIPLLLVGDPAQLPPIGETNEFIGRNHAMLTQVQRQALDSPILWAATKIRQGEIVKEGNYDNILFVGRKHQLDEQWLRKDVQFLVGLNDTRRKLNTQISGSVEPEIGDKIIFLRNHWEKGLVNGSIVELKSMWKNFDAYSLTFKLDNLLIERYKSYYQTAPKKKNRHIRNTFDKAFAITTHKAQGKSIRDSIVIIDESYYFKEYATNWIYTAITRSTGEKPVAWLR